MNIAIVGLGIIGGSLAKAFTAYTQHRVIGINRSVSVAERALSEGAIHEKGTDESLKQADVVFMCTYPKHIVSFVKEKADCFKKGCIITDVCGIKSEICSDLTKICEENGLQYVGSHPMAGKEKYSYDASEAELFKGASYIIVPCNADEASVKTLKSLAEEIGFGTVRLASPEEHDRMIAFTSQVPHALACAYVMSPCCPNHKGFSAGSYRDVSRVASINENLWTDLFLSNRQPLSEEIGILIKNLSEIKSAVDENDSERLRDLLKKSREIKQSLGE